MKEKHETFFSACTYSEAKCTKQVFSFAEKWQRHKIADCNGVQWREYVQGAINWIIDDKSIIADCNKSIIVNRNKSIRVQLMSAIHVSNNHFNVVPQAAHSSQPDRWNWLKVSNRFSHRPTRSYFSALLPDPVFCSIPDPTRYWKTLPAGHWVYLLYIELLWQLKKKTREI